MNSRENSNYHSFKMKQPLVLLRRPLPPKLPKLPLQTRKIHTATTDETISTKSKSVFLDVAKGQSPRPVSIQSIVFDTPFQGRPLAASPSRKPANFPWSIPDSAFGSMFFPSCHLASLRFFRKDQRKRKHSQTSKKKQHRKEISGDVHIGNMLVVSSKPFRPLTTSCSDVTSKFRTIIPEHRHLEETPDYTQEFPPIQKDLSVTFLSATSRSTSAVPEIEWTERFPRKLAVVSKVMIKMTVLPDLSFLPTPVLPRKPLKQVKIENMVERGKAETVPRQPEVVIKPRRRILDPDGHVLHGERFNTVAATRHETILAVSNLAIINCQIHGRNALNLKGFFLLHCPDLKPVAFQLIYLNLSFNNLSEFPKEIFCLKNLQILKLRNNPITEIPTEIQQLTFLRSFNISFNKIEHLPSGLFCLIHLEELNVSYNEITEIPNEIQKLRALDKLIVDGNYMTSFPPGILKLKLKKIQYENTFTSHHFWAENSLNSPQRLSHIAAMSIVKNNFLIPYSPILIMLLKSTYKCDWCHGPRFGKGFRVIRSCDIFGATQLPILFHVCSPACYVNIRESSFVLEGFPSRRIPLNMDWVKERRASELSSFYL